MRRPLALLLPLLLAPLTAAAADGTLTTGAAHEVVWTPPTVLTVRGPRYAPVTLDLYVALGHLPSYVSAELARRAFASASDVRVVLHPFGFGPPSDLALEALVEAARQGRMWPLFDRMVTARAVSFTPLELGRLGREAGPDGEALDAALAARSHRAVAAELRKRASEAGYHAPELVVNGRRVSPWSGDEALARAVAEARGRAHELLDDGVPLSQLYERLLERDQEVPFTLDPLAHGATQRLSVDTSGSPARGPAAAPVTIVIFGNFACPACADLAQSVAQVRAAHPGLVRVVWKHFPSPFRATGNTSADEYGIAAELQGRFWELYDLAMAARLRPAKATPVELERLAAAAGLDPYRLHADLTSGRTQAQLERDSDEAHRLGVPSPGSVVVDGVPVAGAPSAELLERLVARSLDAGVLERLRRR